ncbi:nitrilase family protein [Porphyromonas endodontalis]
MAQETLTLALAQCDIVWENPTENLQVMRETFAQAAQGGAEIVVFPEVMTTGFSMHLEAIAEPFESLPSLQSIRAMVQQYGVAVVSSLLVKEGDKYFNRIFFITPEGEEFFQDKRHLFRMGGEAKQVSPAGDRHVFSYRGWNILLIACYDMRFPVWCRNRANEYDLLIDVANWPEPRRLVWSTLLRARAMENLAYVCGVNRVGRDAEGLVYTGDSALIDPKGRELAALEERRIELKIATLERAPLDKLRKKFPVYLDADEFSIVGATL